MDSHETLYIFRFQSRVMYNMEGEVERIDSRACRVLMKEAHE